MGTFLLGGCLILGLQEVYSISHSKGRWVDPGLSKIPIHSIQNLPLGEHKEISEGCQCPSGMVSSFLKSQEMRWTDLCLDILPEREAWNVYRSLSTEKEASRSRSERQRDQGSGCLRNRLGVTRLLFGLILCEIISLLWKPDVTSASCFLPGRVNERFPRCFGRALGPWASAKREASKFQNVGRLSHLRDAPVKWKCPDGRRFLFLGWAAGSLNPSQVSAGTGTLMVFYVSLGLGVISCMHSPFLGVLCFLFVQILPVRGRKMQTF